jgi:hypothetical protein
VWDEGEEGIPGLTVTLESAQAPALRPGDRRETTTDDNGYYRFDEVSPGSYVVTVSVPIGYRPTTATGAAVAVVANAIVSVPPIGLCRLTAQRWYLPLVLRYWTPVQQQYLPLILR